MKQYKWHGDYDSQWRKKIGYRQFGSNVNMEKLQIRRFFPYSSYIGVGIIKNSTRNVLSTNACAIFVQIWKIWEKTVFGGISSYSHVIFVFYMVLFTLFSFCRIFELQFCFYSFSQLNFLEWFNLLIRFFTIFNETFPLFRHILPIFTMGLISILWFSCFNSLFFTEYPCIIVSWIQNSNLQPLPPSYLSTCYFPSFRATTIIHFFQRITTILIESLTGHVYSLDNWQCSQPSLWQSLWSLVPPYRSGEKKNIQITIVLVLKLLTTC